jgi:hypothetical protein
MSRINFFNRHKFILPIYTLTFNIQYKNRLEAEQRRLEEIGPIAYYSEWVEAYKNKDTSREAIQKHFEETGEDENVQLIKMFQHQTAGEYRIMMGTDVRIQRDPLAMRMREDQIKQSISLLKILLLLHVLSLKSIFFVAAA